MQPGGGCCPRQSRGSYVGGSAPGGKRDAVGSRSGVVGVLECLNDGIQGGVRDEREVDTLDVVLVEASAAGAGRRVGASSPNFGPEVAGNEGLLFGRRGRGIRRRSTEVGNAGTIVGKLVLKKSDRVRWLGKRRRSRG